MNVKLVPDPWAKTVCIVSDVSEPERQAYLTPAELKRVREFAREKRRAEWAASRIGAKLLALALGLCDDAQECSIVSSYSKPHLQIGPKGRGLHVSISHSEWAGAAAIDRVPIGLDIQKIRELKPRITKFFLKDEEVAQMQGTRIEHPLIHFWCAKEAAYKLRAGRGWLKRVTIDLQAETGGGLGFTLSDPVAGTVNTFRVDEHYIAAVARQLKPGKG